MNRRDLMTIGPMAALVGKDDEPKQATFEGWAIVQIMGHQQEAGFVTTEYYGASALFRITVPPVPARSKIEGSYELRYAASPERFRLISPLAVHSLFPCSKEEAIKHVESLRQGVYAPVFGSKPVDEIPF